MKQRSKRAIAAGCNEANRWRALYQLKITFNLLHKLGSVSTTGTHSTEGRPHRTAMTLVFLHPPSMAHRSTQGSQSTTCQLNATQMTLRRLLCICMVRSSGLVVNGTYTDARHIRLRSCSIVVLLVGSISRNLKSQIIPATAIVRCPHYNISTVIATTHSNKTEPIKGIVSLQYLPALCLKLCITLGINNLDPSPYMEAHEGTGRAGFMCYKVSVLECWYKASL